MSSARPASTRSALLQVFSGDVAGKALAVIASLVIVRVSDAAALGVFTLFLALQNVFSQVAELGTGLSIVQRLSGEPPGSPTFARTLRAAAILRGAVLVLLVVPLLVIAALAPESGATREGGVGSSGGTVWPLALRAAALSTAALSVLTFALAYHQATGRFRILSALRVGDSGLRLLLLLALLATVGLRLPHLLAIYVCAPLIVGLIGSVGPARLLARARATRADVAALFRVSRWMMLASMTGTFLLQIDAMLLAAFAEAAEVGEYGAALRLVVPLQLVAGSVATVLLPRFAGIPDAETRRAVYHRTLRWAVPGALLLSAAALLLAPLVFQLFPQYGASVPLFRVLCLGHAAALASGPALSLLYAEGRAGALAGLGCGLFALAALGHWLAIPAYGAFGAACVTSGALVIGAIATVGLARR